MAMTRSRAAVAIATAFVFASAALAADPGTDAQTYAQVDKLFADYALDARIPGLVYGIVADGKLVHVQGFGVQDLDAKRPVTADSLFRIASMTKVFTALTVLKLRDDGKLRLDALAEDYVPELRGWTYPTTDSPRIRVRDLLNHTAGFVTDDPWGDRQTPLPEAEFTALLRAGVPFTRVPEATMEYSNLGYALLGRIVTNTSGRPFAETIAATLMKPLGMASSGFDADAAPAARRAQGYDWRDGAWHLEKTMAPGTFGAMGGVQTSANDYAKWIAFLLSAWPARDGAEAGPVKRSTVRELAQGSNFPVLVGPRQAGGGAEACRRALTYAMGLRVTVDCEFGAHLSHGGGYPGYGSFMLLLPEQGVGIFAFANRTYAGPQKPVYEAASLLKKAGLLKDRALPVSAELGAAYRAAGAVYAKGDVAAAGPLLAMNFLMDRDAAGWARDLAELKAQLGDCDTSAPVSPTGALSGRFTWRCAQGRVSGDLLLAPTRPAGIQSLRLSRLAP